MADQSSSERNKKSCVEDRIEEELGASMVSLKLELEPPRKNKKLLILGIGGLLCHRVCKKDRSESWIRRRPDAVYGSYRVYKRPYCEEFVKFCLERFEVGIWSSAREWYLDSALDCISRGLRRNLLFAWDQDQCTKTGFNTLENENKPIFLKELKKVWQRIASKGEFSASNTLLIDNQPYKALTNPPHTAIFPHEYKVFQVGSDNALGPNGDLWRYLEGLSDAADVPSYVEAHPFGQAAVTSSHPSWDFYYSIISQLAAAE